MTSDEIINEINKMDIREQKKFLSSLSFRIKASIRAIDEVECRAKIDGYAVIMSEILNVDKKTILSKSRARPLPYCRYMIAKVLHDSGYTYSLIADTMSVDHCTIMHGIETIDNAISYPSQWGDVTSIWNKFKEKLR